MVIIVLCSMDLNLCQDNFENDRKPLSEIKFKMQVGRWKEGRMMSAKPGLSSHHIDLFACIRALYPFACAEDYQNQN